MCLIIASKTGRPKEEYIRNGFANHSHGAGIAWHQDGEVFYKKDISVEEAITMAAELPIGFVIHCRWASVGGQDKTLIHPFPIRKDVPLLTEGSAKSVLFQNGTWSQWNSVLVNHLTSRITLPRGKWSDTRALAFLVSVHGPNILNLIDRAGKFIIMADGKNLGFGHFEEEDGVLYSNGSYKTVSRTSCGTGLNESTATSSGTSTTTYRQPGASQSGNLGSTYTPASTSRVPAPSQPLCLPSRSSVSTGERERLTEKEYEELQEYFEKHLSDKSIAGVA